MSKFSRRALLHRGLIGGGALVAGSLLGSNSSILAADDHDVDAGMREYFSARFRAIDSGDPGDRRAVLDLIAQENNGLREFVDRDLAHLSTLVRSYGPILNMQHDIQVSGRVGNTFLVREGTRHSWGNPLPRGRIKPEDDPRAAPDLRPVIRSGFGYHHTITLDRSAGHLRVHSDAFRGLGGDSPDVKRTSLKLPSALPTAIFQPARLPRAGGGKLARPLATGYFWDQAVNYCYTFWDNYNTFYWNYSDLGGDCTNFISQALANAGWTAGDTGDPTAYWYDAALQPLQQGTAWYNNNPQRTWILANTRGWDAGPTPQSLLRGDIVYYDWNSTSPGTLDHTAMVTTIPVSTYRRLVSAHFVDIDQQDWESWPASHLRPFSTVNLQLFSNF